MKALRRYLGNLVAFALIVWLPATCAAQLKKAPTKTNGVGKPKTATYVKGDNSLLFEISGNRLSHPSWLFGTMHILCADDARLSESLKNVIASADQVFFEVNMSDMASMMGALQYMRMNDNKKLSDLLTPVEYDRLKAYFDKNKSPIPLAMMSRFKPFFISAMIGEQMLDCPSKSSMEQEIMNEAKKKQKKIDGLETIEFQASLMDSIPYEEQAHDLMNYVDSAETYRTTMREVASEYKKQNLGGLDSLMQKSDPGMTKYLDLLLYQRNHRWYDQIAEQIYQHPTLFAVGAGHLAGDKGVISLLRQHGFTVRALKN